MAGLFRLGRGAMRRWPRGCQYRLVVQIDLVRQCQAAGVACFVKQVDIGGRVSHDPAEWPEALRVREYPKGAHNG